MPNKSIAGTDANDLIYQVDASRNYNPWPRLEAIIAPTTWVNSADDFINPRNLDYPQRAVSRMKDARFRLIPESAETRGHGHGPSEPAGADPGRCPRSHRHRQEAKVARLWALTFLGVHCPPRVRR